MDRNKILDNEGIACRRAYTCPLCGKEGKLTYRNLKDRLYGISGVWNFRYCRDCDIMWLDPKPEPTDIPKLYENYFTHKVVSSNSKSSRIKSFIRNSIVASELGYDANYEKLIINFSQKLISLSVKLLWPQKWQGVLSSYIFLKKDYGNRILDVGCGNGHFLKFMKQAGWEVWGVEPDEKACDVAKSQGIDNIFCGTLSDVDLPANYFDVITLRHVIEHLWDPEDNLLIIRRLLKPTGRIVIATPNIKSFLHTIFKDSWRDLDPPRHLVLFSPKSLKAICNKCGFQKEKIFTSLANVPFVWKSSMEIKFKGKAMLNTRISWIDEAASFSISHIERIFNTGEEIVFIGRPVKK